MQEKLNLANLPEAEKNERAAAAVTPYGLGTRSYNRSTEKREMDRQRKEATAALEVKPYTPPILCRCLQRSYPHETSIHREVRFVSRKQAARWPWSLKWLELEETSAT